MHRQQPLAVHDAAALATQNPSALYIWIMFTLIITTIFIARLIGVLQAMFLQRSCGFLVRLRSNF